MLCLQYSFIGFIGESLRIRQSTRNIFGYISVGGVTVTHLPTPIYVENAGEKRSFFSGRKRYYWAGHDRNAAIPQLHNNAVTLRANLWHRLSTLIPFIQRKKSDIAAIALTGFPFRKEKKTSPAISWLFHQAATELLSAFNVFSFLWPMMPFPCLVFPSEK